MEKTKTLEKTPTRLGRGLAALIPPSAAVPSPSPLAPPERGRGEGDAPEGVSEIALSDIVANPNQPRTVFNQAAIDELAASIRTHGVLQPVMVRPRAGGRYEIVAGERRYRAALEAGLKRIPAVIRSLTDEESLTVALIENIQREDLNPIEAARAYKQLMDDYGLTQTQLGRADRQEAVHNLQCNASADTPCRRCRRASPRGDLTEAHGKTLLAWRTRRNGGYVAGDSLTLKLSVKETQEQVDEANYLCPATPKKSQTSRTQTGTLRSISLASIGDQFRTRSGHEGRRQARAKAAGAHC